MTDHSFICILRLDGSVGLLAGDAPSSCWPGDGVPATRACLGVVLGVALNTITRDIYYVDCGGNYSSACFLRVISAATGVVRTLAGGGGNASWCTGIDTPALQAHLVGPYIPDFNYGSGNGERLEVWQLAVDSSTGNVFWNDKFCISVYEASTQLVKTYAGSLERCTCSVGGGGRYTADDSPLLGAGPSSCVDGAPPRNACFSFLDDLAGVNEWVSLAVDVGGNLFVADKGNARVWVIDASGSSISTYACKGNAGSCLSGGTSPILVPAGVATATAVADGGVDSPPFSSVYIAWFDGVSSSKGMFVTATTATSSHIVAGAPPDSPVCAAAHQTLFYGLTNLSDATAQCIGALALADGGSAGAAIFGYTGIFVCNAEGLGAPTAILEFFTPQDPISGSLMTRADFRYQFPGPIATDGLGTIIFESGGDLLVGNASDGRLHVVANLQAGVVAAGVSEAFNGQYEVLKFNPSQSQEIFFVVRYYRNQIVDAAFVFSTSFLRNNSSAVQLVAGGGAINGSSCAKDGGPAYYSCLPHDAVIGVDSIGNVYALTLPFTNTHHRLGCKRHYVAKGYSRQFHCSVHIWEYAACHVGCRRHVSSSREL